MLATTEDGNKLWHVWPLMFGLFAIVAHWKLRHFMSAIQESDYTDDLKPLIKELKDRTIAVDVPSSLWSGIAFILIGVALIAFSKFAFFPSFANWVYGITPTWLQWLYPDRWHILLAIPAFYGMSKAIKTANFARRCIEKHLDEERIGGTH